MTITLTPVWQSAAVGNATVLYTAIENGANGPVPVDSWPNDPQNNPALWYVFVGYGQDELPGYAFGNLGQADQNGVIVPIATNAAESASIRAVLSYNVALDPLLIDNKSENVGVIEGPPTIFLNSNDSLNADQGSVDVQGFDVPPTAAYLGVGDDTIEVVGGFNTLVGGDGDDLIFVQGSEGAGDSLIYGDYTNVPVYTAVSFQSTSRFAAPNGVIPEPQSTGPYGQPFQVSILYPSPPAPPLEDAFILQSNPSGMSALSLPASNSSARAPADPSKGPEPIGDDTIRSGAGRDTIFAGPGNDLVSTGFGNVTVDAGSGDDIIQAVAGIDTINGGDGNDTASWQLFQTNSPESLAIDIRRGRADSLEGGVAVPATFFSNIENLIGPPTGANIGGDNSANILVGLGAIDLVSGIGGNDTLSGGGGNDNLLVSSGANILSGDDGNDSLTGGSDNDVLDGGAGNDTLNGGAGADIFVLRPSSVPNGTDTITDFLQGADKIGLAEGLTFSDLTLTGNVIIETSTNSTLAILPNFATSSLTASDFEEYGAVLLGSIDDSQLIGGSKRDLLHGLMGDDVIRTAAGDDIAFGNSGRDLLDGGAGN
ncbi:MAG: calcium-binding protein, partial [Pseudomonadota bacterium]